MLTRYRNSNNIPKLVPFSIVGWDAPWRAFGGLRIDLDRLFGAYEQSLFSSNSTDTARAELRNSLNDFVITVDLPGVSKKDLELSVSGDNVSIKATRTASPPEGYATLRKERTSYTFERSFKLPAPVESQKAEAILHDGVLTVTLPKSPNAQPKQIPVKGG